METERDSDQRAAAALLSRRLVLKRGAAATGAALFAAALTACGATPAATSLTATIAPTKAAGTNPTTAAAPTTGAATAATAAKPTPTGAFSVATSAATPATAATAAGSFDWQRFKGTTLRVFVPVNPAHTTMRALFPEFERLTGMKIEYEELPENNSRQKLTVEFTAGQSQIDIFASTLFQEKRLFAKNGWYAYVDDYLKDPKLTSPEFDYNDFFQGAKDAITVDGKLVGMPTNMDTNCTYYRKDLFDAAGLKPPTNMDELEAAAKRFHNPPNMYGFVARGQKTSNATQIDPYLRNFGGGYFDGAGNPILDSDGNVKAVDFYAGMLKKYGPPGVTNFSWPEASQLFQQGRAALYTDGVGFAGPFEDPSKSTVAGKMGYGPFPAGPAGNFPPLFGSSMSIYSKSSKKEAAWYFVQWATSKATLLAVLRGGTAVGRASSWNNPEARVGAKLPGEFFDTTFAMLKISVPGLAPVINVAESRDIVSVGVIDVINGQDAKTVMARVQKEFKALVDREKAS